MFGNECCVLVNEPFMFILIVGQPNLNINIISDVSNLSG